MFLYCFLLYLTELLKIEMPVHPSHVHLVHVMADFVKETDCIICMDKVTDPYTVQCGSSTPHVICNPCELQWRLKSKPTTEGRTITCPMCRTVETDTSTRSTSSLQAELAHVYFELATKNGNPSNTVNQAVRDYIQLLENVVRVPHIQLDGLLSPSVTVQGTPISRRSRTQIEMEARAVRAVVSRQEQANLREATRASQERRARLQQEATERRARARQARRQQEATERQLTAVWCESGNIALGMCPTSRKTTRYCAQSGCFKRVCFRCDKCTTH